MKLLLLFATLLAIPIQEDGAQQLEIGDGSKLTARIVSVDAAIATVVQEDRTYEIPVDSISRIRFNGRASESTSESRIQLVDGSSLVANGLLVDESLTATFSESPDGTSMQSIHTRNVDFILFKSLSEEMETQWQQLMASDERASDWLVFEREAVLDYVEGVAGPITSESISFTTDGRTAEAPRSRVCGIACFHATGRHHVEPIALLTTTSGSRLLVHALETTKPQAQSGHIRYTVRTVCGAELVFSDHEIVNVDFAAMRFLYLSEIAPSTVEWNPMFYNEEIYEYQARLNAPRYNESYTRTALSLNVVEKRAGNDVVVQRQFASGIAIKGGTRMVFPLEGRFTRLQGIYGFSPEAPLDGLIELVLKGDGNDLYRRVLDNRQDQPQPVDIDIRDVGRLTIEVRYHDGRNIGDVIHFCDLKVSR